MDKRIRLVRREFARLRTEKTILLAILVQLLVASFSSVLMVGFVSMYDPGGSSGQITVEYAVVGDGANATLDVMADHDGVDGDRYLDFTGALDAYRAGDVDAVIYLLDGPGNRYQAYLYAPQKGLMKSLVIGQSRTILETLEEERRLQFTTPLSQQPLPVPDDAPSEPYFEFIYTLLVPVLVFLPAFISGSLVADSLTEGQSRGTLELLQATPLSDVSVLDAKALSMIALAPIQTGAWMGLLQLNGLHVQNIPLLLGVSTAAALLVASIGAVIALYYTERGEAQFVYSLTTMAVVSLLSLLPEQPINLVAKLAIGSETATTFHVLSVYLLIGCLSYIGLRRLIGYYGLENIAAGNT